MCCRWLFHTDIYVGSESKRRRGKRMDRMKDTCRQKQTTNNDGER